MSESSQHATTRTWYTRVLGVMPVCLGILIHVMWPYEPVPEVVLVKSLLLVLCAWLTWSVWAELLTRFDERGFKRPFRAPVPWSDVIEVRSSSVEVVFRTVSSSYRFRVDQFRHVDAFAAFLRENVPVLRESDEE